jgi:hypothetical protein
MIDEILPTPEEEIDRTNTIVRKYREANASEFAKADKDFVDFMESIMIPIKGDVK